jgi:hypothetical protein
MQQLADWQPFASSGYAMFFFISRILVPMADLAGSSCTTSQKVINHMDVFVKDPEVGLSSSQTHRLHEVEKVRNVFSRHVGL